MSLVAKSPLPEVGDGRTSTWHSGVRCDALEDRDGNSWDVMFGLQVNIVDSRRCSVVNVDACYCLRASESELFQSFHYVTWEV